MASGKKLKWAEMPDPADPSRRAIETRLGSYRGLVAHPGHQQDRPEQRYWNVRRQFTIIASGECDSLALAKRAAENAIDKAIKSEQSRR